MPDIKQLKNDIIFQTTLLGIPLIFHSTWGIFSPRAIDDGTNLLLKHLSIKPNETVLDIGCGYGAIGLAIAARSKSSQVHMVDKDFIAVKYANKNIKNNQIQNAEAYLSNGLDEVEKHLQFSTVVSNIPAKVGKEMLSIILHDVHQQLKPNGQFVVVTVNGLRQFIKRNFIEVFGNYEKIKQGKNYTISRCIKINPSR